MKKLVLFSVLVNLGLVGAVGYIIKNRSATTVSVVPKPSSERVAARLEAAPNAAPSTPSAGVPEEDFSWRKVESPDYKEYIENLRAIGCPEKTIRDIIRADVKKLYAAKFTALNKPAEKKAYWKMNMMNFMPDQTNMKERQKLMQEKVALLKDLLGPEGVDMTDMNFMEGMEMPGNELDYLSPEKQSKIATIQAKQQAKIMKIFSGGAPDQEDMKEHQKLQKQMEADIATLLTPEEFEQYQVRNSQTAQSLKYMLKDVDINEEQYLALFKARKPFDEANTGIDWNDQEAQKRYQEQNKIVEEQTKQILGDQKYVEYQRSQDQGYQAAVAVAKQLELPKESANKVYDLKKLMDESTMRLYQDTTISQEERQETILNIYAQTESGLKEVLGEKGFDALQKNPQSWWLKNMKAQAGTR